MSNRLGNELGNKRQRFHHRDTEGTEIDDLAQSIAELARGTQNLAREAERQYLAEVEDILKAQSRDSRRIERCLDGMLDSCFDNGMLVLFIKLCRYYFAIDPDATASYIHPYIEVWEGQTEKKGGGHD